MYKFVLHHTTCCCAALCATRVLYDDSYSAAQTASTKTQLIVSEIKYTYAALYIIVLYIV